MLGIQTMHERFPQELVADGTFSSDRAQSHGDYDLSERGALHSRSY
jgi:hypothetical protein